MTRASLPEGVGQTPFGPNLLALIAMLSGSYRLSKRQIQSLLETLWGLQISRGGITACEQRVSQMLKGPYDGACGHVKRAPVAFADETPWFQRHKLAWLWTAGTHDVVTFRIDPHRTTQAAKQILGDDFRGTLVSDRYGGYRHIPMHRRQVCWAHLQREFVALSEFREPVARFVVERVLGAMDQMFALFSDHQAGVLDRIALITAIEPVCRTLEQHIEMGAQATHPYTRSKCRSILKHREAFFNFVHLADAEPTNNRSERALRHAVIYRRISLGTQSDAGSRFVERMQTVVHSLKAQGRNLYDFLHQITNASLRQGSLPSLLPG